jgi:hypothetical protein
VRANLRQIKRAVTHSAGHTTPTTTSHPSVELTGFGATEAAWKAHHRADDRFTSGSAYDPDPSLARNGDQRNNDRYYDVQPFGGHITDYETRFPSGTGIAEAKQSVLASEFPQDARITSFKRRSSCAQMVVKSATLGTQGPAFVELSSGAGGDQYDPTDVWTALLQESSGSGLGC